MKEKLEIIKDAIIEFDDRLTYIMFEDNSYGSETTRAMLAVVLLPALPLVAVYGVGKGTIVLTSKIVNKIKETKEEKEYYRKQETIYEEEIQSSKISEPVVYPTSQNEMPNQVKKLVYTNPDEKRN